MLTKTFTELSDSKLLFILDTAAELDVAEVIRKHTYKETSPTSTLTLHFNTSAHPDDVDDLLEELLFKLETTIIN